MSHFTVLPKLQKTRKIEEANKIVKKTLDIILVHMSSVNIGSLRSPRDRLVEKSGLYGWDTLDIDVDYCRYGMPPKEKEPG